MKPCAIATLLLCLAAAPASRKAASQPLDPLQIRAIDLVNSGNVKPLGVIQGPQTRIVRINQIQMQPSKGWIVAAQPGKYEDQEPEGALGRVWTW